jgi:hypothetical protein
VTDGLRHSGVSGRRMCSQGADDLTVRVFLTLVAAMDRARDADRLWQAAADLWADEPRVFSPTEVAGMTESGLRSTLSEYGVSQRHQQDTAAWRRICESLLDPASPRAIRDAVLNGESSVWELRRGIARSSKAKPPWFPLLHGPKISEMWIRMLAEPGGASISEIDDLRVAVDVQVRKVSEYLGVTDTGNPPLDEVPTAVRSEIQRAWHVAWMERVAWHREHFFPLNESEQSVIYEEVLTQHRELREAEERLFVDSK